MELDWLKLQPRFVRYDSPRLYIFVDFIDNATGVQFLCPVCFETNGGPVGTHYVLCWAPSVPLDQDPRPGRWNLVGTCLADLSLVAGSSSVRLTSGCNAHFYVKKGRVESA